MLRHCPISVGLGMPCVLDLQAAFHRPHRVNVKLLAPALQNSERRVDQSDIRVPGFEKNVRLSRRKSSLATRLCKCCISTGGGMSCVLAARSASGFWPEISWCRLTTADARDRNVLQMIQRV